MFKYAKLYAYNAGDNADIAFQKRLLVIICSFLFLCGGAWWLLYYTIFGWGYASISAGGFGILVGVSIVVSHVLKNHYILAKAVFFGTFVVPIICQWAIGSMHDSGMIIAWAFLTPLGILIFLSIRPALVYMVLFIASIVITALFQPTFPGAPEFVADGTIKLFYCMNLGTSFAVFFATSAWFVHTIKVEKRISEDLLLNILPKEVAYELKKFGKVEPITHEHVTVLFTDFKEFTKITESVSAKELVAEINHCFGAFDEITTKYDIEKIKTLGDSYMAVGGNFSGIDCTPSQVVSAGLEMRDYIIMRKKERDKEGKFAFEMRIGVHTGSVISGVVGVKKFQFDIWGDTVNIASRMENNSDAEEVNISGKTFDLVKNDFEFEFRGTLPVKGKRNMRMYFVKGKKVAALEVA